MINLSHVDVLSSKCAENKTSSFDMMASILGNEMHKRHTCISSELRWIFF